jgi:hypothetical protein
MIKQTKVTIQPPVQLTPEQELTLYLGALRYYMGRMTYAVSDFCDLLIQVWPTLDVKTKSLIQRDLTAEFRRDDEQRKQGTEYKALGMDQDRAQWLRVQQLWSSNTPPPDQIQ